MNMRFVTIVVFAAGFVGASYAQSPVNPEQNKPLEITADESLEWHRNDLYFKARKNVRAVQGATTLTADMLTAKYSEGDESGIEIHTIQADGNVRIVSAQSSAYGGRAVYDVDKGSALMTGGNLRIVSDDQTVSAQDRLEYNVNQGKMEAIGNAKAVREGDTLTSDKIIAIFAENTQGKRVLKTLEAIGNVVITTPTEVLKGERALYTAGTSLAELKGNVIIKRGPNKLEGNRAEVNLKTNISKIFGGKTEGGNGRVRGVFYPGSEKK